MVHGHAHLSEVRDNREATTIATAMDLINAHEFGKAMDVLTMRLIALTKAKSKGGTWNAAQRNELIALPGAEVGLAGPLVRLQVPPRGRGRLDTCGHR